MKNIFILILSSLLFAHNAYNQSLITLSNNIGEVEDNTTESYSGINKIKAMLYSGLLPGAGQYLVNNQKNKAIIFMGLELLSWAAYSHYTKEAENYKKQYRNYVDENWSFASWCDHYYDFDDELNYPEQYEFRDIFINLEMDEFSPINSGHGFAFYYDDPNSGNRVLIHTNTQTFYGIYEGNTLKGWDDLGYPTDENEDGIDDSITSFIELTNLSVIKDHDFYEGVIKYDQFFAGWNDQNNPQRITNGWGDDNITSPNKSFAKTLYDNSVKNYKIQDSVMSAIYINHAVSMLDALIVNTISSNRLSLSYDYNSIINFHQAQLSVKLN